MPDTENILDSRPIGSQTLRIHWTQVRVDAVDQGKGWPPLLYAAFMRKQECVLALLACHPGRQLELLGGLLGDALSRVNSFYVYIQARICH
jgi:hypothetical protein